MKLFSQTNKDAQNLCDFSDFLMTEHVLLCNLFCREILLKNNMPCLAQFIIFNSYARLSCNHRDM